MINTILVQKLSRSKTLILAVLGIAAIGGTILAINWEELKMNDLIEMIIPSEKMSSTVSQEPNIVRSMSTKIEPPKFSIYDYLGYSNLIP